MSMQVFNNYTDYRDIEAGTHFIQTFLSDPTRLSLNDLKPNVENIVRFFRQQKVQAVCIHSNYLIGEMTKGYQKALLKQELGQTSQIQRSGVEVVAYVLHLHSREQYKAISSLKDLEQDEEQKMLAFENTSHRCKRDYIKLLYDKRIVIDTAHLYCSGLADSASSVLQLLKHLNSRSTVVAIHLNDQLGQFGSGRDLHAPIGKGLLFTRTADALDLLSYIVDKYTVILEYSGTVHAEAIRTYKQSNFKLNKELLQFAAALCVQLAESSHNNYQQQAYYQYRDMFAEIADKLETLDLQQLELSVKANQILLYTILTTDAARHKPLSRKGTPRKTVKDVFERLCKRMGLIPGKQVFIAGSYRRNCNTIGDIDVLLSRQSFRTISEFASSLAAVGVQHEQTRKALKTRRARRARRAYSIYRFKFEKKQIDLYVCSDQQLPCMLFYLTGSAAFNIRMRRFARQKNFKLTNTDLLMKKGSRTLSVPVKNEKDIFDILGLQYIPPEYRIT